MSSVLPLLKGLLKHALLEREYSPQFWNCHCRYECMLQAVSFVVVGFPPLEFVGGGGSRLDFFVVGSTFWYLEILFWIISPPRFFRRGVEIFLLDLPLFQRMGIFVVGSPYFDISNFCVDLPLDFRRGSGRFGFNLKILLVFNGGGEKKRPQLKGGSNKNLNPLF